MITAETFTSIRLLVTYPIFVVAGIAWFIVFRQRWRNGNGRGERWSAILGLSLALFGMSGIAALWFSRWKGEYSIVTSAAVTLPGLLVAAVLVVGAIVMSRQER